VVSQSINQSINQSNKQFLDGLLGPPETVSWCPAISQEKTSWTGVSWGGDNMRSMILLMTRLPGSCSMSVGRRLQKLGYQQSTVCW